ncbi:hypothetical protein AAFF27_24215 [Xylophilus sp. GW821-FHT01B05]
MLEAHLDQGAGLRLQMPQAAPRLAALVSQGDPLTELPLLWQLCAALQALGYQVAVLDATVAETADAPGLAQLLDGSMAADDELDPGAEPAGLAVFPAASGLAMLTAGTQAPAAVHASRLARLARVLRPHDLALLYGSAELLARWTAQCGIVPVLPAAPLQSGVLAAYQSLRVLHQAGVVPTLASVVTRTGMVTAGSARAARDNLARCAADWLGCRIEVLRVRTATADGAPVPGDVHRLALRLLEGAAALAPEPVLAVPVTGAHSAFDRSEQSH